MQEPRFENCTCGGADTADEGYCDNDCVMIIVFLFAIGLALIANMSTQIPNIVITLRFAKYHTHCVILAYLFS